MNYPIPLAVPQTHRCSLTSGPLFTLIFGLLSFVLISLLILQSHEELLLCLLSPFGLPKLSSRSTFLSCNTYQVTESHGVWFSQTPEESLPTPAAEF